MSEESKLLPSNSTYSLSTSRLEEPKEVLSETSLIIEFIVAVISARLPNPGIVCNAPKATLSALSRLSSINCLIPLPVAVITMRSFISSGLLENATLASIISATSAKLVDVESLLITSSLAATFASKP